MRCNSFFFFKHTDHKHALLSFATIDALREMAQRYNLKLSKVILSFLIKFHNKGLTSFNNGAILNIVISAFGSWLLIAFVITIA